MRSQSLLENYMVAHTWKNKHEVPENWDDFEKFIKEYPQNELSELLKFSDVLSLVAEGGAQRHHWQTWQLEYYKHVPSEHFFAVLVCYGNTEYRGGLSAIAGRLGNWGITSTYLANTASQCWFAMVTQSIRTVSTLSINTK